ncbi:MAG: hypothetical protein CMN95_03435 [Synechococcus sp. MED650]|nr:hypothetical protein [Synechococcus sp. MED650]OUW56497.1 MAG: hypothetical protein CBD48_02465 [Cyanobacteria bacterium TMED188]
MTALQHRKANRPSPIQTNPPQRQAPVTKTAAFPQQPAMELKSSHRLWKSCAEGQRKVGRNHLQQNDQLS